MGSRLNASVMETVNTLRAQAQASKTALDGTVGELRGLVLSAHTAREQNRWLFIIGGVGILLGLLLYAAFAGPVAHLAPARSEEHTSELQSLMRISYAVFCLKNKIIN